MFHTFFYTPTIRHTYLPTVLVVCLLSLIHGCGNGSKTATVSGKITFQNKPVTSGLINFMPLSGRPLGGGIQADGTYEFRLPSGEYKVRIDTPPTLPEGWKEGDPPPKMGLRQIPYKYGRFQTSRLTILVGPQDDTLTFDFQLK